MPDLPQWLVLLFGLIADRKLAVETQQQIKRARQVNLPGPLL